MRRANDEACCHTVLAAVAAVGGDTSCLSLEASLFDAGLTTPEQLNRLAVALEVTVDQLLAAPTLREVALLLPPCVTPSSAPERDAAWPCFRTDGFCEALRVKLSDRTFDLPVGLGILYFLNSCVQSLPLTANMGFLNDELHMPQPQINLYYAVTFMPWSLKPLYGLLADGLPVFGYHYRPWLAMSSAGSACFYLLMARGVTTIGAAFLVGLLRAICNAFSELMLGVALVNFARRKGGGSAATLQARHMSDTSRTHILDTHTRLRCGGRACGTGVTL